MRADRLLSNLGYGGRKEMTMAIKNGWFEIDGERMTNPSFKIDQDVIAQGRLAFDDAPLDPLAPFTIMLNKPAGYTCSKNDAGALVYELLPPRFALRKPTFSSIGRLDKASTGQLLFTDDGDLLHRIIHPKTVASKKYHVTLRDPLRGDEAKIFADTDFYMKGDDKPLKPAIWTATNENSGTMILSEGRYHQIRRMFETLDNEVTLLHRFQTGGLPLGDLAEGKWRILDKDDLAQIFA
ncbi:MAG: pseudouridine synthase [Micavibrio sp.]|nr:pseudouridine synthase [Micavibrio sp.]